MKYDRHLLVGKDVLGIVTGIGGFFRGRMYLTIFAYIKGAIRMNQYVRYFSDIDKSSLASVGGKGANLGELYHVFGSAVPAGFCVTTSAYRDFVNTSGEFAGFLNSLELINAEALPELKEAGQRLRRHLESLDMPDQIQQAIIQAWRQTGSDYAYAIRSSATAEDLPGASFAGQQDTFLNIEGEKQILDSVRKCWASLFTDRAIAYRQKNGFEHKHVLLAVVVQRMVFPEVSGIMFTAEPVTGNRKIVSIDASFGLGEALVSGIVSADLYQVRANKLIKKQIAKKEQAIYAKSEGGTVTVVLSEERQTAQALSDETAIRLAGMGGSIEGHFGNPQDIEWCLANNEIFILQSRPITTLYPIPQVADAKLHLFISFGHQQMMTEAMKPLGISALRTLAPIGKKLPQDESDLLLEAGGRLYVDVTQFLEYPQIRKRLPELLLNIDEMIGRAVQDFIGREEVRSALQTENKRLELAFVKKALPTVFALLRNILYRDNSWAIDEMNLFIHHQVKENKRKLQKVSGPERIEQIQEILATLLPTAFLQVAPSMGAAIITYKLIENLSEKWLGDAAELDSISKSPSGNVTTEMGLALGDVADALRNHPAVIEYLKQADNATFFDGLRAVPGGEDVLPVFLHYFEQYGMRGTGEIDVTRPRWREVPTQLVPVLLSHSKSVRPGQHRRDFLAGKEEAELAADRLLNRLRQTPRGNLKAKRMQRLLKVHRTLIGIREHPKYFIVQNLDLIKQAIMQEAAKLVTAGILEDPEDVFWFSLQEIKKIIETQQVDQKIIARRKEKFQQEAKLAPPRAITSEGEIISAKPGAQVPPGALAGSPVSAGTVEGYARVILKLEEAKLDKGDILVAPYTDPAWTPLFPLAAGLVTEVGGLMTHGAVVAREYGIPAVVGVDQATRKIQDGQKIRVDGSQGFIEILENETLTKP
ncbi:rifamycin-inactivating phosphotransferase [Desulforamulus aeronauticus]|uniref:Rifampicin phosphotransferase n=1 Tax=Desulforamulus aeronauticus DSM 10349 TaxID=1121421 RepID=A0A1M6TDH0_9FIRM|nr:rifamycin-inactivating phosphotransferase [Desulforamulus aeronauticus]SHK55047.1 pyruvate, water dikinase [Desulforamulus aeronauticus DSM 10349]